MIELRNIIKIYNSGEITEMTLFKDFSLTVADSRYMGMQMIIVGTALQMALYNWILIYNLKKREKIVRHEQAPIVDDGGFRYVR